MRNADLGPQVLQMPYRGGGGYPKAPPLANPLRHPPRCVALAHTPAILRGGGWGEEAHLGPEVLQVPHLVGWRELVARERFAVACERGKAGSGLLACCRRIWFAGENLSPASPAREGKCEARADTLPNIGVPHYIGVPHRATYPYSRWTTKVSFPSVVGRCVTKFAPHKALHLVAWRQVDF